VEFEGGTPELRKVVELALNVSPDEAEVMRDMHGFHSYPARLHPLTARALVEGLSNKGARVLDPFCGSGTVVAEARALGRVALGSDLNPLAVELSWLKSRGPTERQIVQTLEAATRIAEVAEERRLRKADPYQRYDKEERERYPIHMLLELDSLAEGISALPKTELTRTLRLVVSSILTKVAYSEGDTTRRKAPRRLPGGFAIQAFLKKTEELADRLRAYRDRIGDRAPRATVACADARQIEGLQSDSIDLIVTSPPYPGIYDYLEHHLHRLRWLGLKQSGLQKQEMGSKRSYRRLRFDQAQALWHREMGEALWEMRRTLANDGQGVVVVADSVIDGRAFRAAEEIRIAAERGNVEIMAIASQERPLFLYGAERAFADQPRREHLVIFRPGDRRKTATQAPEPRAPKAPPNPNRRMVQTRGGQPARPKKR
jgi:SAM-dependent methyltransferase